jgi:hypothetical protein
VVAKIIEGVDIEALAVGSREAFAKLFIEDGITEALASDEMVSRLRKTDSEQGSFG